MKRTIGIAIAVLLLCIPWAFAQEDPEPTPLLITYGVQIAWGSVQSTLQWVDANIVSTVVVAGDVGTHSYRWTTLGQVTWEFRGIEFDIINPQKVVVVLQIDTMGGPFATWGFYRIRVRAVGDLPAPQPDVVGDWVESYWVPVIDVGSPARPNRS